MLELTARDPVVNVFADYRTHQGSKDTQKLELKLPADLPPGEGAPEPVPPERVAGPAGVDHATARAGQHDTGGRGREQPQAVGTKRRAAGIT